MAKDAEVHDILSNAEILRKDDWLPDVFASRARVRNNRGGGDDNVVPEMLKLIPPLTVYDIYRYLLMKLSGATLAPSSWLIVVLCWIQKELHPKLFKHLRGIALMSCMSKWMMALVMRMCRKTPMPRSFRCVCYFVFEVVLQVQDVAGALIILLARSSEWAAEAPVYFGTRRSFERF